MGLFPSTCIPVPPTGKRTTQGYGYQQDFVRNNGNPQRKDMEKRANIDNGMGATKPVEDIKKSFVEEEEDPALNYSDTDYNNLSLDDKIFFLIETVCYRLDSYQDDADLTCVSVKFNYFEESASSLKVCVEQFCSSLRRDLADARAALGNIEQIINSFDVNGRTLVYSKNGVYVEGDPKLSSWVTNCFNDCLMHKKRFHELEKMIKELVDSIGYYIAFRAYLIDLETPELVQSDNYFIKKRRVIGTISYGFREIITKLTENEQYQAVEWLKLLYKKLQQSCESNESFDLLTLFAQCCFQNYETLRRNPDTAVIALKQLKKYVFNYDRYYKLYTDLTHAKQLDHRIIEVYCNGRSYARTPSRTRNNSNWQRIRADLAKLQLLVGEVCHKWNKSEEYYLSVVKKQSSREHHTSTNDPVIQNNVVTQPQPRHDDHKTETVHLTNGTLVQHGKSTHV